MLDRSLSSKFTQIEKGLDLTFSPKFSLPSGYYRVNYDKTNWQLIIKQLNKNSFGNISTINRAQLIDDALNLARAGRLDYATALSVTSYLAHETEYLPWKAAFTAMHYLDSMLIKMPSYDRFRVNTNLFSKFCEFRMIKNINIFRERITFIHIQTYRFRYTFWNCSTTCTSRSVSRITWVIPNWQFSPASMF